MGSGRSGLEPIVPRKDVDPTHEQLSVLHAILAAGSAPCADLSVWGLYGNRHRRTFAFEGCVLSNDGTLRTLELKGPSTYEEWRACNAALRTAMLMLDGATPESLDNYAEHVRRLHQRHGPRAWLLLYLPRGVSVPKWPWTKVAARQHVAWQRRRG